LDIPKPVVRLLSIYLLISIGMLGGYKLSLGGLDGSAIAVMAVSVVASFSMPFATYWVLRLRLSNADAAAVAATFGSISAVTFITAVAFLDGKGVGYSGYMVASMALMESPAIISAVLLARIAASDRSRAAPEAEGTESDRDTSGAWREALFNGPVVLLIGSMAIGAVSGERGWATVAPLLEAPFQGVLCLFLLDMGLVAARRIGELRSAGVFLVTFGIVGAVLQGVTGVGAAWALGLGAGDALLIAVLFGSASYIAVPAAMRLLLPEANPSIYVTVALTITFPFNIVVGIPMYHMLINALGIGA
ncbi:MAG: sodium-dependent bicarbonate transport family permease, partial [Planctomycetota bacterium]|nr:sodium-dependent bicarbonate transport family permease [Planctomycetota bacterium]